LPRKHVRDYTRRSRIFLRYSLSINEIQAANSQPPRITDSVRRPVRQRRFPNPMRALSFSQFPPSGSERVCIFHREACFSHLRRVRRRNTRKLCAHVIDDVEIAVRTVVISQPHIGTRCLRVRGIKLKQACDARQSAVLLLEAMSAALSPRAEPLSSIHLP
jgi:hypothetical protein